MSSVAVGVVVALVLLAGLWWADSELGLVRTTAPQPGPGALIELEEPVVTPTAEGNGHAARARVAARLEPGTEDAAGSDAVLALERATRDALATSTTAGLARPDGLRALRRRIPRGARSDGGLPVERVYLTELTWS
jgi:hypothetical protein